MTRAALTKLLCLVILAFILCLPEFFTVHRVLSLSLRCVRLQQRGDEEESTEETGVMWSSSTCPEQWEHLLRAAADQRNVTQTDTSCFVCQANVYMPELDHNSSSSAGAVLFEVSLTLQQSAASLNLTLFGYNHSSQYLHLSDRGEAKEAFLHCPPSVDMANHSCCLLLLSNWTFARGGLPWKHSPEDEWRCTLRVTWLFLLCVVLLLIVITVAQQITEGRKRSSAKSKVLLKFRSRGQDLIDRAKQTEVNAPIVLSIKTREPYSCTALSSIEEVETPEETETEVFFNDNMGSDRNGNVQHRNSRSPSVRRTVQTMTTSEL